ncbi:MAG: glycyl-radical enzyme activating protein [Spirochaetia bacterium]|jgi:pyruvate formate lyase activating enzyme
MSDARAAIPPGAGRGIVFEIERYALKDGPGIRTVVFLKGCLLRCLWCSNPESQEPQPQLVYWREKCLNCRACITACPHGALSWSDGGVLIDRRLCRACGTCAKGCNAEALVLLGRSMSAEEIFLEVQKDAAFYRTSGGGVTFSGGEPFEQPELLRETARLCKGARIHTGVETSGLVPWETMAATLPVIDLVLFDLKEMDPVRHRALTSADNQLVLENFRKLMKTGKAVIVRVPLIPRHNDRTDNYLRMIEFLRSTAPGIRVDLLPYHRLGRGKYRRLNLAYQLEELEPPSQEHVEEIRGLFESAGFPNSVGG